GIGRAGLDQPAREAAVRLLGRAGLAGLPAARLRPGRPAQAGALPPARPAALAQPPGRLPPGGDRPLRAAAPPRREPPHRGRDPPGRKPEGSHRIPGPHARPAGRRLVAVTRTTAPIPSKAKPDGSGTPWRWKS